MILSYLYMPPWVNAFSVCVYVLHFFSLSSRRLMGQSDKRGRTKCFMAMRFSCVFVVYLAAKCQSVIKSVNYVLPHFQGPHSESLVTMETKFGERPNAKASIPRLQSEAVASDLQELSLQPAPNLLPVTERKNGQFLHMHRHNCVKVSIKWFVRGMLRNSDRGAGQSCK